MNIEELTKEIISSFNKKELNKLKNAVDSKYIDALLNNELDVIFLSY